MLFIGKPKGRSMMISNATKGMEVNLATNHHPETNTKRSQIVFASTSSPPKKKEKIFLYALH